MDLGRIEERNALHGGTKMSYIEVFAVRTNGDITKYGEAHNSYGGAMYIWMKLKEKYNVTYASLIDFSPLWGKVGTLEEADNWVLASTFDYVVISKEHLPTLIKHLKTFVATYRSSTLEVEIEILERALRDDTIQAVAFNQTSVNADMWCVPLSEGEQELIGDCTRPYNIYIDTGHWYLTPQSIKSR